MVRFAPRQPGRRWRPATQRPAALLHALLVAVLLTTTAAATQASQGQNVLHILVEFPDLPGAPLTYEAAEASFLEAGEFMRQASWGELWFDHVEVVGPYMMPEPSTYYAEAFTFLRLMDDARAAAYQNEVWPNTYWSYGVSSVKLIDDWAGQGWIGMPGIWLNGTGDESDLVAHEFGHNLGAHHAGAWIVSDGNPLSPQGQFHEYGDRFDIMGARNPGFPDNHFNSYWKSRFGWINSTTNVLHPNDDGTYRLYAHDAGEDTFDPEHTYALTLPSGHGADYWLEYRSRDADGQPGSAGLQLRLAPRNNLADNAHTLLIDPSGGTGHAALSLGQTFNDPDSDLNVTVVGTGHAAGQHWIDVHLGELDLLLGDMNLDGFVDTADVAPFVLALTDPAAYQSNFGIDPLLVGDINGDGAFDTADVAPFVSLLLAGAQGPDISIPEPASLALLGLGGLMLLRRRLR